MPVASLQDFKDNCTLKRTYRSKKSSYWQATYKDEVYKFCISNHHGSYRGKLFTFISLDHSESKARQFAGDMRAYILKEHADYDFKTKTRQNKDLK